MTTVATSAVPHRDEGPSQRVPGGGWRGHLAPAPARDRGCPRPAGGGGNLRDRRGCSASPRLRRGHRLPAGRFRSLSAGRHELLRRLLRHRGNRYGSPPGAPGADRCVRGSTVACGRVRERHVPLRIHPGLWSHALGYGETRVARRGGGGRGWGVQHRVLVGLRTAPRHEGLRLQLALLAVLRPTGHRVRRLDARRIRNWLAHGRADPTGPSGDVRHAGCVVGTGARDSAVSFARTTGQHSRQRIRTLARLLRSSASGGRCTASQSACPL